jgi:hypothetical protein
MAIVILRRQGDLQRRAELSGDEQAPARLLLML